MNVSCVLCGHEDSLDETVNQRLLSEAKAVWNDGRNLGYVCADCGDKLPLTLPKKPWSTPKAGDACESGATAKQQAGWPSLTREAQRTLLDGLPSAIKAGKD